MKRSALLLALFFTVTTVMVFVSCKKGKDQLPLTTDLPQGIISGKVVAANGTTPIPSANVFVDINGEIYLAETRSDGTFTLQAPAGDQVLNIQTGSGRVFRTTMNVTIREDETVNVGGSLKLLQVVDLAYIAGYWDNIQTVIIDTLGYTADELFLSDLSDIATLQNYGGIFLNCGMNGTLDSLKYANLATYVEDGGSLYVSDFAVDYLTGDGNFKSGPNHSTYDNQKTCVGNIGGFIDDNALCCQRVGPATVLYDCDVVDPDLQAYLGVTTMDVEYDLGSWEVIQVLTGPWEVLVEDNVAGFGPLAVRMYANGSNFKNMMDVMDQGWVTICHIPPGNPGNAHTITISINALPAHIAHGDYIGPCQGGGTNGGTIYFTTFHNQVQGTLGPDVKKMLEYFVLNL